MVKLILFSVLSLSSIAQNQPSQPQPSPELKKFFDQWLSQNPKTLNEALTKIPEPYWKNFALMKDSRSIQSSSAENPRVLLYGNTAETVISYNGDPKHSGYNRLEIADFDPQTKTINFYEVDFKKETKKKKEFRPLTPDEIWQQTSNLRISKANPEKCMGCHQVTFSMGRQEIHYSKYVWDEYKKWPGAYGEHDDALTRSTDPNYRSEEVQFLEFKKKAQSDKTSRYHHLIFEGEHPQSPYLESIDEKRLFKYMPNSRLGILLAINHSRMVADVLTKYALENNKIEQLKEWICKDGSSVFGFPGNLSLMSTTPWQTGVLSVFGTSVNDNYLGELIKTHTAYRLWNLDSTWINTEIASFYKTNESQEKFITEVGLIYFGNEHVNWTSQNKNRLINTYCQ